MSLYRRVAKLAHMDRNEVGWRTRAAVRIAVDRARAALVAPTWDRQRLTRVLAPIDDLGSARQAAAAGRWQDAHTELARLMAAAPQRFVIAPSVREDLIRRIRTDCPAATREATARGERIVAGDYDLLGYRGLRFDPAPPLLGTPPQRGCRAGGPGTAAGAPAPALDWHYDPVHDRRAPMSFWSTVPFLDPSCGDHKIIWELNRHQHWLALGRAFWLTGDRRYRSHALAELASWIDANPPLMGINWASMLELAFRSLSWIWALNFFVEEPHEDRSPWLVDLLIALDRQLEQIARNLSYYFSPNTHLLGEALALYVAGRAVPSLAAGGRYEQLGRAILIEGISRQIATDGGHCERSTHYHRYTLDFYLLALAVARITGDPAAAQFEAAARRLGLAARLLADSRGRLPHVGDDDGGATWPIAGRAVDDIRDSLAVAGALTGQPNLEIGPPPEEACWLLAHPALCRTLNGLQAAPVPVGSGALPETGYYVSRSAAGDHLLIDAGPHGYQNAGHAHADALALTFTLRGVPLLVDPGTGCYTIDASLRERFRSTALHNTLTLDEAPQSIPAGPFHWLRAANADARRWRTNAGFDYLEASHDGYRPLEHRRHVLALHGDLLVVADLVAGTGDKADLHRAEVHWHIDPRWTIAVAGRRANLAAMGERVELLAPHGMLELFTADDTGLGWQAPVYGRLEPAVTVRISHTSSTPLWIVTVFGLNPINEVFDVDTVPVWAEAGVLAQSLAIRVSRAASNDFVLFADAGPLGRPELQSGRADRSWRLAEFETDARMLFCRTALNGRLTRAALVDGTRLRSAGRARLALTLPGEVTDLHVDLSSGQARLSGSAAGARVQVGSRAVPLATERRGTARGRPVVPAAMPGPRRRWKERNL